MRPRRRNLLAPALLVAVVLVGPEAAAGDPEEDPKPRAIDPGVAPGPWIRYAERPPLERRLRACAARAPVCVQAGSARDGHAALAALGAFERAWQTLTGALGIAPPDLDPTTLSYDVFLADRAPEAATTLLEARDIRSRVDRARAFTLLDRRASGCALDAAAAFAIARASLYRVAPATEEGTAIAQSTYLAALVAPCSVATSVHAFQARPERAFADALASDDAAAAGDAERERASDPFAAGAAMFWARLDWAFGRSPGILVPASWALHPTMTPPGASRWINEPDTFDVLRVTFKGAMAAGGSVHDLWLDFAIARAFAGSADDGLHVPELRTAGEAARVPLDWDLPWPERPRRVAARTPVYPTGASYVLVRHAGAPAGARLRVEIEWEEHALFRWAFVKLDAAGRELGRVPVITTDRATHAQMSLVADPAVDRVLLVGVNVGDPAYAFDPDDEVWEPHAWLVTLAQE